MEERSICLKVIVVFGSFILHVINASYWFGVLFSELIIVFEADKATTAWIPSIYIGVVFITGSLSGVVIDVFGMRASIIFGSLLMTLGLVTSAFIDHLHYLYLTYGLVTGFGSSLLHIAGNSMVVLRFNKWRSLALGFASTGVGIGSIVMSFLVEPLIDEYGWPGTFIMVACLSMQGVVVGAASGLIPTGTAIVKGNRRKEEVPRSAIDSTSKKDRLALLKGYFSFVNRDFKFFACSGALLCTALYVPYTMVPDMMVLRGLSLYEGSWAASGLAFGNMIGRFLLGVGAHVTGIKKIYPYIFGQTSVGFLTLAFIYAKQSYQFIVIGTFFGLVSGSTIVLLTLVTTELVGAENVARAFGLVITFGGLGALISPPVAGWLTDITGTYDAAFYLTAGLYFLSVLSALPIVIKPVCSRRQSLELQEGPKEAQPLYSFTDR